MLRKFFSRDCSFAFLLFAAIGALGPNHARAQAFTVIHHFGAAGDGARPAASVTLDKGGTIYGTTFEGGTFQAGTIFKASPGGDETVLYNFGADNDGCYPEAPLLRARGAGFVSTSSYCGDDAGGTVYRTSSGGKERTIFSFTYNTGYGPVAGLIADAAGNFYGTNAQGGANNAGTVFKVSPDGSVTVLYAFTGGGDGSLPLAPLVADKAGNLFGSTYAGGAANSGVIFKIDTNGKQTVLYSFLGGNADGAGPTGNLVLDRKGNLYGTTGLGGSPYNTGTVFKLTKKGAEKLLHVFQGNTDGALPVSGLIQDKSGNFYGMTVSGGSNGFCNGGCGTVFKISPDGSEHILHAFVNSDGSEPQAGLTIDDSGQLFGTTFLGGAHGSGVLFSIKPE